ncbi:MAG: type II toxin-antitoxin system Phd/YefM family antitoxin [Candidatus Electrothrix sp. LOE2]|nr:type II toxin-antitoxin system Phd/YefM family antitoxin [Candidatus Electrothrix sp. LOE2]
MSSTTMSCTALNRNIGKAKKAARTGPVIITNRGQPAYVLMNIAQYQQVTGNGKNIVDLLAMPGAEDIDFNPPRLFATPPSHSSPDSSADQHRNRVDWRLHKRGAGPGWCIAED